MSDILPISCSWSNSPALLAEVGPTLEKGGVKLELKCFPVSRDTSIDSTILVALISSVGATALTVIRLVYQYHVARTRRSLMVCIKEDSGMVKIKLSGADVEQFERILEALDARKVESVQLLDEAGDARPVSDSGESV